MRRRTPYAHRAVAAIVLSAAALLLMSCGSGTSSAGQTTSPPTTVAPTSTSEAAAPASSTTAASTDSTVGSTTTPAPGPAISPEDAQAVRDVASAFWEAYNAYDPDKAVSYLDESYRTEKERIIRGEIGQIKTFGVKLGVSEKTAPVLIGPDQAEMYLTMKEPTGTRTLWMKFARHGDTWTITYSEETT